MREILFRGKRVDNGKWVEGQLLHFKASVGSSELVLIVEGCEWDNANEWFNLGKRANVIPETVGQYTGLTDKNGKKIFEGDILLVKTTLDSINEATRNDEYIANGVVVFNEGHFELEGKGLVLCTYWGLKSLFAAAHFKEYEVIGNIHDNPELLKGGE